MRSTDRVLPFFDEHGVALLRILTDRGSEYCGNRQSHEFVVVPGPGKHRTHAHARQERADQRHICERFHQTIRNEFYASAFRRKPYHSLDELQADVDVWMQSYHAQRSHSGKYCYGKTPLQTFIESATLAYDKQPDRITPISDPVAAAA